MSTNKKKTYLMDEFSQGTYGNLLNLTGEYASPVISKVPSVPNNTGTQVYTGNSNAYQGGTVYLDMQVLNPTGSITNPTEMNYTSSLVEQNRVNTNPMHVKHYTNESVLNSNVYGNYLKDGEPVGGTSVKPTNDGTQSDGSDVVDGSGSGGEGSGKEKVTTAPMTYAEYIESQKGKLEEQRKEAERQAEIYAQRARANAQASYMQNMSTYGINAETLAQMGLTGGGYSDYLNAQAYAQKQNAINTANANELTAKQQAQATYADNINKLEASAFEQRNTTYNSLLGMALDKTSGLTDEYIKAMANSVGLSQEEIDTIINTNNETQAKDAQEKYNALMLDLGNVNTYGNYTEDDINTLAEQWGLDDEKKTKLVEKLKATKAQAEVDLEGGKTDEVTAADIIGDIQQGNFVKEDGTKYTWAEIESMALRAKANGAQITDEDISKMEEAFDLRRKLDAGEITSKDYYGYIDGTNTNSIPTDKTYIEKAKELLGSKGYKGRVPGKASTANITVDNVSDIVGSKVIYTLKDGTTFKDFGDYQTNAKQEKYFDAIMNAVRNGDNKEGSIPVGSIVKPNYGSSGSSNKNDYFIYIGNGIFVALDSDYGYYLDSTDKNVVWTPEGYYVNDNGNIRKSD